MEQFFVNFIKTGDPNGAGVPTWPRYETGQRMFIEIVSHADKDESVNRYEFLETAMHP